MSARSPLLWAMQLADSRYTDAAHAWWRNGVEEYVLSGGEKSLERCLGLSPKALPRYRRDLWLIRAAALLTCDQADKPRRLAEMLDKFEGGGVLRRWRDDPRGPQFAREKKLEELDEETAVRVCFFNALKLGRVPRSAEQLRNILAPTQNFLGEEILPAMGPNVAADGEKNG